MRRHLAEVAAEFDRQIPDRLCEVARSAALRHWVAHRGSAVLDYYYDTVDRARMMIASDPSRRRDPSDDQVVPVIASVLRAERALRDYCLDKGYEIKSDEQFFLETCHAAGWEVLRRYRLAVEKGDWPRD